MNRQEIYDEVTEVYGFVPEYIAKAPDSILEQFWSQLSFYNNDSALSARDKALIGFGVSAAIHCEYWIPFHKAQFALFELSEEQAREAAAVVQAITGFSAYFYGTGYSHETFLKELDAIVAHALSQGGGG